MAAPFFVFVLTSAAFRGCAALELREPLPGGRDDPGSSASDALARVVRLQRRLLDEEAAHATERRELLDRIRGLEQEKSRLSPQQEVSPSRLASGLQTTTLSEANIVFGKNGVAGTSCDNRVGDTFDYDGLEDRLTATTSLDEALGAAPGIWQYVRSQEEVNRHSAVDFKGMDLLGRLVLWAAEGRKGEPLRTVETGFAQGHSALALVGSARGAGLQSRHTALDPYQEEVWGNHGNTAVTRLIQRYGAGNVTFSHLALPAAVGLSDMHKAGECVDVAFMDDGHKFDDNMSELYFLNRMMGPGGVIVIDDTGMKSVNATVNFVEANLPFRQVKSPCHRYAILVKTAKDERSWTHYQHFGALLHKGARTNSRHFGV